MSDQYPPTGPQEPDPRWGPPAPDQPVPPAPDYAPPGYRAPGYQRPPADGQQPPYAEQPPAYGQPPLGAPDSAPPVFGQQPLGQAAYGQPAYGQPAYGDVVTGAPTRSKRGLALGGGALALALVAGGGLYFASQAGSGGDDDQPEAHVPATAFAFARIDLDPSADQKVAVHEFASKFPSGPKTTKGDPIQAILTEMLKDSDNPKCTYETALKPWLGKRVGVAAITGAGGKTQPLLVIQVKDEAKAKAAKALFQGPDCASDSGDDSDELRGFTVTDGYALMSTEQADVDAAISAAKTKSLKDADTFTTDVEKLEGNQIMVGWVDLERAFDAASKESPQLGMIPNNMASQFKGRVVMGMHMGNDFAEMTMRVIDGAALPVDMSGDAAAITKLPASTVLAISANGVQQQIEASLTQMQSSGLPLDDMLKGAGEQYGLDIRGDLLPLLGSSMTLSLGNVPTNPLDAKFGLQSTVKDPKRAAAVGKKLAAQAAKSGVPLEASVDGSTFYLTSKGYTGELKKDGALGTSPTFVKAMGDLKGKLVGTGYVDLSQLAKLGAGTGAGEDLEHLSALGVSARVDDGQPVLRMRLVVK